MLRFHSIGHRRRLDLTLLPKLLVYSRSVYAGCFERVLGFAEGGFERETVV
jgi:hypothetical protein